MTQLGSHPFLVRIIHQLQISSSVMKTFIPYTIYLVFISLIIYSGYLYSIRWNFAPWGSSNNDGLFFLFYYILVLPMLLITSILKRIFLKHQKDIYLKYSFYIYTLVISLPSLDTYGSQISLGFGVTLSMLITTLITIELCKYFTSANKSV